MKEGMKMSQKKIRMQVLVTAIFLLAFIATSAVGLFAAEKKKGKGQTVSTVAFGQGWVENLAKRVPEFEKKTGIKVNFEMTSFEDAHTKMMLDIQNSASGKTPDYDFYWMDIPWKDEFVNTGVMLDLTDLATPGFKRDDFDQHYLKAIGLVGDRIYMYPILSVARITFYRTDLFNDTKIKQEYKSKYGANLAPPKTWEEFNRIAAFFTGHPKVKYGCTASARRGTTALSEFVDRLFGIGGMEFNYYPDEDAWEPLTASDEAIRALELYTEIAPYTPPGSADAIWDLAVKAFAAGDVAMMDMWDAFAPMVTDPAQSSIAGKIGFAPSPGTHLGGWGLCINKHSPNADAAYQFLEWATGYETAYKYVLDGPGMIPRKSLFNNPNIQKKHPWVLTHAENLRKSRLRSEARVVGKQVDIGPTLIPEPQYELIIGTAVNAAFTGTKSVEEALTDAEREVIDLLKEFGYNVVE
jgi:ABC-type glycerol-3-phosphate transport system substrate-binding protein